MSKLDELHRMAVVNGLDIIPGKKKVWSCKYCKTTDFTSLGQVRKHQKEAGCGSGSKRHTDKITGSVREHAEQ